MTAAPNLQERVNAALASVRNNRLGINVLEAEMIRDVATTVDGKVRFTILLAPSDDARLVRDVRQVVEQVDGVREVRVDVKDASQATLRAADETALTSNEPRTGDQLRTADQPPTADKPRPKPRSLPVMGQEPASKRAAVPAPTPVTYPNLGNILAISSGKGGVGKSTVASNVAIALARQGARVGLMDADIYGPNIPRMMGVDEQPRVENEKIIPLEAHGVKVMSLGFLIERDQPAIWRGPIIMKIITQFVRDVVWGQLDFFLVDLPPGTGDAQLSLVQATRVAGALIVTTPQEVAIGDALRGAKMFQRVDVPVLGVIENMSWLDCAHCGERTFLFGSGGGARLAAELGVPLLGQIPLYAPVLAGGDTGMPIVVGEPESPAAVELTRTAERVATMHAAPAM
ncbi:MAG TPA: Mrp/NBP35 family ATP-binding protein [Gemmatimonadaceae bacterium]|nr:Mrp/NBP35 family ATP-binding protein [Gemmatimonadaceae bacterium]